MKLKLLQVFFVLIGGALFGQTNATLKQSNSQESRTGSESYVYVVRKC